MAGIIGYNHADTDVILQGVIYGYCVKYTRLAQLINANFVGSTATTIDIFVDVRNICSRVLSFMRMKQMQPNNRFFIAGGVINLCAHYREFFRSRYNTASRFWLIDAESVNNHTMIYKDYTLSPLNDDDICPNIIAENIMILNTITPYLPDITMINANGFDIGVNVLDIISKEQVFGNDNPRIILSKDRSALQIADSIVNTFVLRPIKKASDDKSVLYGLQMAIPEYVSREFNKGYPIMPIPAGLCSVLMALTRNSSRHIPSKLRIDTALRKLSPLAQPNQTLGTQTQYPHVWDIKALLTQLGVDSDPFEIELRYKAIDIPIMYEAFKVHPVNTIYTSIVNLYAPEEVKKINEQYFKGIPLDLEVL